MENKTVIVEETYFVSEVVDILKERGLEFSTEDMFKVLIREKYIVPKRFHPEKKRSRYVYSVEDIDAIETILIIYFLLGKQGLIEFKYVREATIGKAIPLSFTIIKILLQELNYRKEVEPNEKV